MTLPEHCVSCGSRTVHREVTPEQRSDSTYTLYQCADCDLQFWWPFQNPGNVYYETEAGYTVRDARPDTRPLFSPLKRFLRQGRRGTTLLDLGMGNGRFLHAAQESGYIVTGCDFSKGAVEAAKEHYNLTDVHCAQIEPFLESGRKFDVITMFELIEHLDSFDVLEKIRSSLTESGRLVLSTPWRGRWKPLLRGDTPPMHLTRWSDMAITNLLKSKGFRVTTCSHCPVYFPRFIRRFSEWTQGYASFGLAQKLGSHRSADRTALSLHTRLINVLAVTKLYVVFFLPALALYAYLWTTGGRQCTTLYVEAVPLR